MASPSIAPLRYQKGGNGSSPNKMTMVKNRPLSELSPMAIRRNSPSFPHSKPVPLKHESSPANSSPFTTSNVNSPHLFWQQRDAASPSRENQNPNESSSPTKRSSLENLKKASRVKNSSMFAKEQQHHYDPARPSILDGRPLGNSVQSRTSIERASDNFRRSDDFVPSTEIEQSPATQPLVNSKHTAPLSPSKMSVSPTKSSLSKKTGANMRYSGFDPDSGIWEDDDSQERKLPEGRVLHRHAKSVTFDQAPPQINEYEMTTPDPSSVASGSREGSYDSFGDEDEDLSYERENSVDHDDSFDASLEDTDKTPVVLPEDWRFMSPANANTSLAEHEEDVFESDVGSPAPGAEPGKTNTRLQQASVNSTDSNGQSRPLPPLPPPNEALHASKNVRSSLSGTIERMSSGQRALPSPPPAASLSKSDLRRMSRESLSLEDRLRLMMVNETQKQSKYEADTRRERRSRLGGSKDTSPVRSETADQFNEDSILSTGTVPSDDLAPRLDRLNILKQLRGAQHEDAEDETGAANMSYDPDVPIPSLEDPTQNHCPEVFIKEEDVDDDDGGLYDIPDMYNRQSDEFSQPNEDESQYDQQGSANTIQSPPQEGHETPRANSPKQNQERKITTRERMSLPEFEDFGDNSSFNLGWNEYLTPPSETADVEKALPAIPDAMPNLPDLQAMREDIKRPQTPEGQLEPPKLSFSSDESSADPGTPDSVIRHPVSDSLGLQVTDESSSIRQFSFTSEKSLNRPQSLSDANPVELTEAATEHNKPTSQDLVEVAQPLEKRISSLVQLEISHRNHENDVSLLDLEQEFDRVVETQKVAFELSLQKLYFPFHGRFPSGDLPVTRNQEISSGPFTQMTEPLKIDGDRATSIHFPSLTIPPEIFANRFAKRQRGYLMRQNTKVVVASERTLNEDEVAINNEDVVPQVEVEHQVEPNEIRPSSRKASQPTWTAEPWNGKSRRRSIRVGGEKATARRKPAETSVPPLPGQPSNVQDNLGAVAEDELAEEEAEEFEDGVERGRMFVKVMGVKNLQLPLPQNERSYFALTLDNGIHCVTTAWLDLGRDAPIGQEFELVVLNDLEFQLTLQMKLEPPKVERPASPSKIPAVSPKKQGAFGRLFGSPKKKKESDHRTSQDVKPTNMPPSAYELVQGLVAKDGSFARAYVSLSEHEKYAYGRPYQVSVKCFNEWAMEEASTGSSRSKKGSQLQQRPPYEIGQLELQLLYIPKPKGAKDEDMPKSMNSAVRALRDAEEKVRQQTSIKEFEGYLSQQGGDCPYWRRRFFKLVGSKLTAYHEATLQPRATINLSKANKLIDDKSSLTQKETSTKGGGRRKSAFADDEEGYMFVEEGFRIRFANGEVIDFYAESTAQKDEWMQVLSQVVGKQMSGSSSSVKGWTEMVLKREKSAKVKAQVEATMKKANKEVRQHTQSTTHVSHHAAVAHASGIPVPTAAAPVVPRPSGHARTESYQGNTGARSQANSPVKSRVTPAERRAKARSMAI